MLRIDWTAYSSVVELTVYAFIENLRKYLVTVKEEDRKKMGRGKWSCSLYVAFWILLEVSSLSSFITIAVNCPGMPRRSPE